MWEGEAVRPTPIPIVPPPKAVVAKNDAPPKTKSTSDATPSKIEGDEKDAGITFRLS